MDADILLGPVPCKESHAQVGQEDYRNQAVLECRAYIKAIRKKLGPEPEGAMLRVKAFTLDFGTHYEVVCTYDSKNPTTLEYASRCEAEGPQRWSEVGMQTPSVGHGRKRLA
jgi:hypothetical protein